ncbi:MAG: ABC transporter permease [Bryobacteraceae bacterium]|nr:ABC transporter permease [Bryobacteraceae bacterium]
MLRAIIFLARKDLAQMFRHPSTWLWAFLMPLLFFFFIGNVTGGFSRPRPAAERIGMLAPPDAGFLAEHLERRLLQLGYQVERVQDEQALAAYGRRLTVPSHFTDDVLKGKQVLLRFGRSGQGAAAVYDEIRVKRAAYTVLADLLVAVRDGEPATAEAMERLAAVPQNIQVAVAAAGRRKVIPGGFQQAVPGSMVMFLLLVMFTTGGVSLYEERTLGILTRLASAPISRGAVVAGKWLSRFGLGMIQAAFGMAAGTLFFKVDWGAHLGAVVLLLVSYGALAAAGGMILGNFGRTEGQVVGLGVILSTAMAMLGGCWWPAEITPLWAQKIGLLFPTGWAMDGLHRLMSFGDTPLAVVPHVAAMLLTALAAGAVLARRFRFQ